MLPTLWTGNRKARSKLPKTPSSDTTKNTSLVVVGMPTTGPKVGIEITVNEFLDFVKADEGERVETLTDEELSDAFGAVSSFLLSSVQCSECSWAAVQKCLKASYG